MNAATANWTRASDDFDAARRPWECSLALNAVIALAAFVAIALAVVAGKSGPRRGAISRQAARSCAPT